MDPLVSGPPPQKFILRPLHKLRWEEGVEAFMNYKLMPSLFKIENKFLSHMKSQSPVDEAWVASCPGYLSYL